MPLTGKLLEVSKIQCPICKKDYGKHSKKQNLKCLYTSNWNLYDLIKHYNELESKNKELSEQLGLENVDPQCRKCECRTLRIFAEYKMEKEILRELILHARLEQTHEHDNTPTDHVHYG